MNAVELLPVFEYDELEFQRRPNSREHMVRAAEKRTGCFYNYSVFTPWSSPLQVNTWGYSTVNFFSPMSRYASNGGGALEAAKEFKQMVKALHKAGIEVRLIKPWLVGTIKRRFKSRVALRNVLSVAGHP